MYTLFYGLSEKPFNLTPDSKFLFMSHRHQEALAALLFGVQDRKGFISLTGEIGSGKTTLLRSLLAQLDPETHKSAIIINSYLDDLELLKTINEQFGLAAESDSRKTLLDELNRFLAAEHRAGHIVILILDEAQNLRPETLEQIRMISNLETETDKLIQIILVGQPELRETLALPQLEQLDQRITVRYHLTALSEDDLLGYIRHRLRVAKAQINIEFTPQALRLIYHHSKGIPRRINVICDRVLLVGYVQSSYEIDGDMVQQAVNEIKGESGLSDESANGSATGADIGLGLRRWSKRLAPVGFTLGFAGLIALGVWFGAALQSMSKSPGRGQAATPVVEEQTTEAAPSPTEARSTSIDETEVASTAAAPEPDAEPALEPGLSPAPTPTPRPRPTPFLYAAWDSDYDHVVRVHRRDHTSAAAYITLLRAWDIDIDLSQFATADPEDVARYDMEAMVRQLDFRTLSTPNLSEALRLDLPLLVNLGTRAKGLSPNIAILRMQGELFTIADPVRGLLAVRRSEIEPHVRNLTVIYRDSISLSDVAPGSEGDAVAALQSVLAASGHLKGEIDGEFGGDVTEAVRAFQREHKLRVTGRIDPLTAALLCAQRDSKRPRLYS